MPIEYGTKEEWLAMGLPLETWTFGSPPGQNAASSQSKSTYGDATLVSDFHKVIELYGRDIPPGFLLHMTRFPSPPAGEISDALFLAWSRFDFGAGEFDRLAAFPGQTYPDDNDLTFACWLLKEGKEEKLARLSKSEAPDRAKAHQRIVSIAARGREELKNYAQQLAALVETGRDAKQFVDSRAAANRYEKMLAAARLDPRSSAERLSDESLDDSQMLPEDWELLERKRAARLRRPFVVPKGSS